MVTSEKDHGKIISSHIHQLKVMKTAEEAKDLIVNSINLTPKVKHITLNLSSLAFPLFAIEYIWVAIV